MIKKEIQETLNFYKSKYLKYSEKSVEVNKNLEVIVSFIQNLHVTVPEEMTGNWGMKLIDIFDRLGDLLSEVELYRKDLHDKIERLDSVFQISEKMKLEKESDKRITDKYLKNLSLADEDLFNLRVLYNSFEALFNYVQRKRETVWELIQIIKKTADVKTSFSQALGLETSKK